MSAVRASRHLSEPLDRDITVWGTSTDGRLVAVHVYSARLDADIARIRQPIPQLIPISRHARHCSMAVLSLHVFTVVAERRLLS